MRFETAQVLDLLGISKEALRHWKTVLSPIGGRDGRSGGYAFSEVLALALIAEANNELDVPVSRFKEVAHRFFSDVAPVAEQSNAAEVVVSITRGDVGVHPMSELPPATALAVVRVDPILQRLRRRVSGALREREPEQLVFDLVVPPRAVVLAIERVAGDESGAASTPRPVHADDERAKRQRRAPRNKGGNPLVAKRKS